MSDLKPRITANLTDQRKSSDSTPVQNNCSC